MLRRRVEIAKEARDIFQEGLKKAACDVNTNWACTREQPILIASSIGSYGAYLADGYQYRHAELLKENDIKILAWFTFNSKDGVNVVSGDSLLECASIAESCNKVVAVGINCTPPRFIEGLILSLKKVTTKPIMIYPNSGERYDPDKKE